MPEAAGVPLIVIVLDAHDALTPAGKPLAPLTPSLLMPVAPVVVMVIADKAVLTQSVGLALGEPAMLAGDTTIGAVLFSVWLQPPEICACVMVTVVLAVNAGVLTVLVPEGPRLTCKFPPPRLEVTNSEGVPVNVNADVVPLQIGDTGETVAVRLDVTVMTTFNGVEQPFNEICVNVMVTPEGHEVPSPKLPGPKLFDPLAPVVIVPLPPDEVVQLSAAPGVAVTENELGAPAQREPVFVEAVGAT